MSAIMIALAVSVIVCLALSRERSLLTGWIPSIVMVGAMTALAAPPILPIAPIVLAAALVFAGMLAGRGRDRLMAAHRGLASIAMGVEILIDQRRSLTENASHAMAMSMSPGGNPMHVLGDGGTSLTLIATGIFAAVLLITALAIVRHLRSRTASGRKGAAQIGEIGAMTLAIGWMLLA